MNNENDALLHNDVEINTSEENIILAPPVELFDEAKEISQSHCIVLLCWQYHGLHHDVAAH